MPRSGSTSKRLAEVAFTRIGPLFRRTVFKEGPDEGSRSSSAERRPNSDVMRRATARKQIHYDHHHEESAVSGPDEDFASMFEASIQAKRIEKGQTIEGTIVAIGAEVAFVNVGSKGEAVIELAELKNDEGALEVAVG